MKSQDSHTDQSLTRCVPIKRLTSPLPFRAGLAMFLISSGSVVLPMSKAISAISTNVVAQVPAGATVIYVNPITGKDGTDAGVTEVTPYKTITYALSQAKANTIIQLAPGSYIKDNGEVFPLDIKQGVTLRGDEATKGQTTVIIGSGSFISPTIAGQNVTILAENDSRISGVTVTNPNSRGTAVWVESTNPTIENNTFSNSKREGVFVTGTGAPKIQNNLFTKNDANGIAMIRSAQGEVRNNRFETTGFGLAIGDQAAPLVSDNNIVQNNDGIVINGTARPVLRNNVIAFNRDNGVVATQNGQPDLGTTDNPGKNLIRNNGQTQPKLYFDLDNASSNTVAAVGNDIDPSRIFGKVDFVAASTGKVVFSDVEGWAQPYIQALASQNIIAGFPDGSFRPNDPVTRAQFAAIINKAFSPPAKQAGKEFTDVSTDFWAYKAIQSAYRGEFVAGYPDRTFKPGQQIPRVQALVSLANGLVLTSNNPNALSVYTDASQIPSYATSAVAAATQRQLVVNYPTLSQLNPNRNATRAEVSAFVYQALVNAGKAQVIQSPYLVQLPASPSGQFGNSPNSTTPASTGSPNSITPSSGAEPNSINSPAPGSPNLTTPASTGVPNPFTPPATVVPSPTPPAPGGSGPR